MSPRKLLAAAAATGSIAIAFAFVYSPTATAGEWSSSCSGTTGVYTYNPEIGEGGSGYLLYPNHPACAG
jgi:hypothetical protein